MARPLHYPAGAGQRLLSVQEIRKEVAVSTPIIELRGLTKRYGDFLAVDGLDLTIRKGEVFGLLGPNGAGKSTTILMMLGLTEPSSGSVEVCGIDATVNPIEVKRRVGYLPDDIGFYESYNGMDNLLYTARLNRIPENEAVARAQRLLSRVGLADEAAKKTGKYSRGMRQRLGLADVLIKNPEVIILDEPTLGIDPQGVREFLELIVRLSREEGITVLLSSHHLHQVQQVCDRVGIFVGGKLLADGDIPTLSAQLFANEAFKITIRVKFNEGRHEADKQRLIQVVQSVEGVTSVQGDQDDIHISCYKDATPHVARAVIENGFDLIHLNHKEHGLDEIYHRYFEGGKADGKTK
ncbi:ABC transporter ATP-binding protein [Arcticibacter tournemirensis]|uniref:ABC transporter ATP-binding protein n=1 Tax=Arcticibacter tournemirensis TaxID=699437 RepID=A0A4Q0MG16_9SPHI|nr:ABC transporter ATP-binding protein [Arcticibacter tournemirensis]RXF72457.1 ABC transporter ATP-binding protein [Arcticibacter tournemirensis]